MRSIKTGIMIVFLSPIAIQAQNQVGPLQQLFKPRGITFSKEQQEKVAQLQKEYVPKLREVQQARNQIYTVEQRRARPEAIQQAREDGKQGQELRRIINQAIKLTDDQQKRLADLRDQQTKLLQTIQNEIRSLMTVEQRQKLQRGRNPRRTGTKPTHANVKYGPHERNVMDVWLAKSDKPTPVLVSIHGGGFRGGNKSVSGDLLRQCLDSGISVVAITYRLSSHAIAPAQFHDSARAIQFIRHNAKKWNLDPTRIASTGGSAGAGLSLWLGFHDDLADPKSKDPILRESSRLTCMVVYNGQTSYDPRFIRKLFPDTNTYQHPALSQLYEVDLNKLDDLPTEKYKLFEEVSPITHIGKGDAPAMLLYASEMDTPIRSQGVGIHHPKFGKVLKEKMDDLGVECRVETGVRRGSEQWTKLTMDFVKKYFNMN